MRTDVTRWRWLMVAIGMVFAIAAHAQQESAAESQESSVKEHLTKEMYQLFSTDSTEELTRVTERLKEECVRTGDERMFYKAWNNLATHYSVHKSRERAIEIAREARQYAEEHGSRYGLYAANMVMGSIQSSMGMTDLAEKSYREALDYHDRYFGDESAAYIYVGLAKIYQNRHQTSDIIEVCEKALKEPGVIDIHRLTALGYMLAALSERIEKGENVEESKARFREAYKERKRIGATYHGSDGMKEMAEYFNAKVKGDGDSMIYWANKMGSGMNRMGFIPYGYYYKGDYSTAFNKFVEYKRYSDSVNNAEMQKQAVEMGVRLNLAKAENEAKDLEIERDRLLLWGALGIGLLIVGFMGFYMYRRNKHVKVIQENARMIEEAYGKLEKAYETIEETTAAKERVESELRIAREIQMGMVPRIFPAFPDRKDIDIYASLDSAKEVGGDLYDFFLSSDRLYYCIGDVSGKGIPASMFMSVVVNLFRMVAKEGFPPEYIATKLNERLAADNDNGMFCTMFIGEIDLQTGAMRYCNAGHNPPIMIDGPLGAHEPCRPMYLEMEANAPIGLWENMEYVGESIGNVKGRTLFLYTDGLSEAENISHELYGEERLIELFRRRPYDSAQQTIDMVNSAVAAFVGDAEQSDDVAMLCLRLT